MFRLSLIAMSLVTLSGCAMPAGLRRDTPAEGAAVSVIEAPGSDVIRPRTRPGVDDATVIAPPAPASDGFLGETLAGLGSPGETGVWLRTGLVSDTQRGRVVAADGRALTLELRPTGAAASGGSQISLMAMQSLGLPLGQLATLRVFVD